MSEPAHGREPLYLSAYDCGHPEPPEPDGAAGDGWSPWDDWHDSHAGGVTEDGGGLVCLLTPAGWYCPACTAVARAERDLPEWEHLECQIGESDD